MGKNHHHKKAEKKEKSKVKLKGKKTLLPKGQNITDTSFKVKKIVIREQLKTATGAQPLSSRKLNIKELLSRLQHYNTTMRKDGLNGIKELVTNYPEEVLTLHLSSLVEAVTQLIIDREPDVRRESLKVLRLIMTQVSVTEVVPFFDILQSYLGCAMTHIHPSVQEDSLLLLDILLDRTPSLVAAASNKILPKFLDMISKLRAESKPGRTLTVKLGSKMTSIKWRIRVLTRLHSLLGAIIEHETARRNGTLAVEGLYSGCMKEDCLTEPEKEKNGIEDAEECLKKCTYYWNATEELYVPLYNLHYRRTCNLPIIFNKLAAKTGRENIGVNKIQMSTEGEGEQMQKFVDLLMPLLFETWLEVGPGTEDSEVSFKKSDYVLSAEGADLLKCVLEIMQQMWEYLKIWQEEFNTSALTDCFKTKYAKNFKKYMFSCFPYSKKDLKMAQKRKKHQEDDPNTFLSKAEGTDCTEQNLALCHLYCCFNNSLDPKLCQWVVDFVNSYISRWRSSQTEVTSQLLRVFTSLLVRRSKSWQVSEDTEALLNAVVACYSCARRSSASSDQDLSDSLLVLLCDLVTDPKLRYLSEYPGFKRWLAGLSSVLCDPVVSAKAVKTLSMVARQKNEVFLSSLRKNLVNILNNLEQVTVSGAVSSLEGKKSIVNLLYWVTSWPVNAERLLNTSILEGKWDKQLSEYISEVLASHCQSKTEDCEIILL